MSMEQPPFSRLTFTLFTFLDIGGKLLNNILFYSGFSTLTFFFFTTLYCMHHDEGLHQDHFSKLHDLLAFFILLSNEILLLANQTQVIAMVKFLIEPFGNFEQNSINSKIVEEYHQEVTLYCKVMTSFYIGSALFWHTAALVVYYATSSDRDEECIHLSVGWIWNIGSNYNYMLLIVVILFMTICTVHSVLWYTAMFCAIIKIKLKLRLLCADVGAVGGFMVMSDKCMECNASRVECKCGGEGFKAQTQTTSTGKNFARLQRIEEEYLSIEVYLKEYSKRKMIEDQIKSYMKILVDQHLDIIEKVKLTDRNIRLPAMVIAQLGVIFVALAIPKIKLNKEFLRAEYIHRGVEVLFLMGVIGLFNYFGQIILDESELLRQALYNCDWTEKPQGLKKGLLIMQTVATKPLKLTISGIYTLSMETYGNIVRAAYSYIRLIQSLNSEETFKDSSP